MADESLLAGLLDRAGKVFSLAGKLGLAFEEERQGQAKGLLVDSANRNRLSSDINEFYAALLGLRDAMQNPPNGFAPVAEQLLGAARIAKRIRDARANDDGFAEYLEEFPELNAVCQAGQNAIRELTKAERLDDPFAFVDEPAATPNYSLLDRFPVTPSGHFAFLEFVKDEVKLAATAKLNQQEQKYQNATIESMVRGIKWPEARTRLAALSNLSENARAKVRGILNRELTTGTVDQIADLLEPAVMELREAFEKARAADLVSKSIVVKTAGDLWKVYAEGKQPCFESKGITITPGNNTPTMTCNDDETETNRMALDRSQALVTAEGGDKVAAMERLIAKVQLQAGMDKASVINMPLADFAAAALGKVTPLDGRASAVKTDEVWLTNGQQPTGENVTSKLPRTADEIELLKPAISSLLQTIPETWATFDPDALTAFQSNALFLLTAAGLIERRGWIRMSIANHPTVFELRFQATGEGGFVKAIEDAAPFQFEAWADTWRTLGENGTNGQIPFHAEGIAPQEWRLTRDGILAQRDLAFSDKAAALFDFVLKRGFYGPGFWLHKQISKQLLTDDEKQAISRHLAVGDDLGELPRPAVGGEGRLVEKRTGERPTGASSVSLANWHEGADSFADAFSKMLGPMFDRLAGRTDSENSETRGTAEPDAATGFLGGIELATALGIHPTQQNAFFQKLLRDRLKLGDDCWLQVRDRRPNSPEYIYKVDSPKMAALAMKYKIPKPA